MKKIREVYDMKGYIQLLSDIISLPEEIREMIIQSFEDYYKKTHELEKLISINLENSIKTKLKNKFEVSPKPKPLSDYIKLLKSKNNIQMCPYCGINRIDTDYQVEHFLPKSKYGEFTLFGFNLFLCCSKCNPSKGDKWENSERLFLNPYLDKLYDKEFIKIVEQKAIDGFLSLKIELFFDNLTTEEIQLLNSHFKELSLNDKLNEHIGDLIDMVVIDVQKYVNNTDKLIEILNVELEKNEENFGKNALRTLITKYFIENIGTLKNYIDYKKSH